MGRESNRRRACGRLALRAALLVLAWLSPAAAGAMQGPSEATEPAPGKELSVAPRVWAEAASANQERIINDDGSAPVRYRVRKVDAKGDMTREVIESKEGTVARLVMRNGQPITAAEDAAERQRLEGILRSPDDFLRRMRREEGARTYATELVHAMARAMLWSYAPGQPQPPEAHGTQVVLDFEPDPKFKPPSLITEALTGISGRVWVDAQSHCVTRIEGRILRPVDFGWGGVFARIREGGSIEFEQRKASEHRWMYSHLNEHITVREVLVHTVQENAQVSASDVQPLPAPVSYRQAIQALLAMPVPVR